MYTSLVDRLKQRGIEDDDLASMTDALLFKLGAEIEWEIDSQKYSIQQADAYLRNRFGSEPIRLIRAIIALRKQQEGG
jgi:hypothetical protein